MPCTSNMTRRGFLKNSTLAAATAMAFPTIIPRHVLGSATAPGANEQIVLGIIGMGVRGNQLVLNVPESGRVAAICDADARKTAAANREASAAIGRSIKTIADARPARSGCGDRFRL